MLKIKDNVELKRLEEYGFKYDFTDCDFSEKQWKKDLPYLDEIWVDNDDRRIIISIEDFCGNSFEECEKELLKDLIKDGLVEKVKE